MRFQLLGPVEVWHAGALIDLRAAKMRTVLAALLLARGRVVSDSALSEMLWGERPPTTADAQIQTYASRLRGLLGPRTLIERQRPGYRMRVPADQLDLADFERLVQAGREELANGRPEDAARILSDALALWRGPALVGVTEQLAETERPHLEEARLTAWESRIEADLALGQHATLVAELTRLVTLHPLREQLRGQLMIALHRCGRRADSLAVYRDGRRVLADELGIDPGDSLRALHQAILTGDPGLCPEAPNTARPPFGGFDLRSARPSPQTAAGPARSEVLLAQLPPDSPDFTGRTQQVAQLRQLLGTAVEPGAPRPLCAVVGMPGAGKTALAVRAAHQLQQEFPDGQLQVDLRGTRSDPLPPQAALGLLVRALGDAPSTLPERLDDLIRLYRSRLTGRRILILLDGAIDEHQIRPLLPGTPECGVLVTSRARLSALDGVRTVELGPLAPREARELFSRIAGPDRVAAEPAATLRVVELCGRLPLALRIAAGRLAARPHWSVSRLAGRLADPHLRLDELSLADLQVRAELTTGYHALEVDARRALRLLSLLDSPSFTPWTAAVALDLPMARAHELVDRLADAHLLEAVGRPGMDRPRYSFHSLVRTAAREWVRTEESASARSAVLTRLDRATRAWLVQEGVA